MKKIFIYKFPHYQTQFYVFLFQMRCSPVPSRQDRSFRRRNSRRSSRHLRRPCFRQHRVGPSFNEFHESVAVDSLWCRSFQEVLRSLSGFLGVVLWLVAVVEGKHGKPRRRRLAPRGVRFRNWVKLGKSRK